MPRLVKILAATFQGKPAQEVLRALREDTRPVDVIMLPEEWQGEGAPIDTEARGCDLPGRPARAGREMLQYGADD